MGEAFVRSLGADDFIDYNSPALDQIAPDMDIVFDTAGGETFQRAFKALKKGGVMVTVVAFPSGEAERYGVTVMRSFTQPSAQNLTAIKDLVEAGNVKPHVDTVLPLAEIKQALALSEAGRARGKIILDLLM